jgi:hypothetical protein
MSNQRDALQAGVIFSHDDENTADTVLVDGYPYPRWWETADGLVDFDDILEGCVRHDPTARQRLDDIIVYYAHAKGKTARMMPWAWRELQELLVADDAIDQQRVTPGGS